jgi:hypothetical protein
VIVFRRKRSWEIFRNLGELFSVQCREDVFFQRSPHNLPLKIFFDGEEIVDLGIRGQLFFVKIGHIVLQSRPRQSGDLLFEERARVILTKPSVEVRKVDLITCDGGRFASDPFVSKISPDPFWELIFHAWSSKGPMAFIA